MPESTSRHSKHLIKIHTKCSFLISTKWYIYIITNPSRKRDMPTTPEVSHRIGCKRCIEVHWNLKSKKQSNTDCHIRISREITVNLDAIAIKTKKYLSTWEECWVIKDTIHKVLWDIIRNNSFLKKTNNNKEYSLSKHLTADMQWFTNLWTEVGCTGNRTSKECWEEADVESIIKKWLHWFKLLSVYIYNIWNSFKGVEANSYR